MSGNTETEKKTRMNERNNDGEMIIRFRIFSFLFFLFRWISTQRCRYVLRNNNFR